MVIKSLPNYNIPGCDRFIGEFFDTFKEKLLSILIGLPQETEKKQKNFQFLQSNHPDIKIRQALQRKIITVQYS